MYLRNACVAIHQFLFEVPGTRLFNSAWLIRVPISRSRPTLHRFMKSRLAGSGYSHA